MKSGQALAHPERTSRIVAVSAVVIASAVGIYARSRRAASRVQQQIVHLKEHS